MIITTDEQLRLLEEYDTNSDKTSKELLPFIEGMQAMMELVDKKLRTERDEQSEQLCQHEWRNHPSHPKIGAMLCRKCGAELA